MIRSVASLKEFVLQARDLVMHKSLEWHRYIFAVLCMWYLFPYLSCFYIYVHINHFSFFLNLTSANPCLKISPRHSNLLGKATCFTPHTENSTRQYKLVRISVFDKAVLSLPPGSASAGCLPLFKSVWEEHNESAVTSMVVTHGKR